MNTKIHIKTINNFLFFIAYAVYLTATILSTSFFGTYLPKRFLAYSMILCLFIIMVKEALSIRLKTKEFKYLIICTFLTFLSIYHRNKMAMIPAFFLIYSARNINFNKLLKFTAFFSSSLLVLIVISSKIGLITNYIDISNNRPREYLGFLYPLYPQILLLNLTSIFLYLYKDKNIFFYISLAIVNFLLFSYTNSRLSFYLSCALIGITYIFNRKYNLLNKVKLLYKPMIYVYIFLLIVSFLAAYKFDYSNQFLVKLNTILENRIGFANNSLKMYPINLFGNDVTFIGNGLDYEGNVSEEEYNYVDCLYINLTESYGIVFIVIYIGIMTYICYRLYKDENYYLLIIFVFFAIHQVIDSLGIYIYYNTFLFAISKYILIDNQGEGNIVEKINN